MTRQSTIFQPDTLEQAIQTVIRDGRIPETLCAALALYSQRADVRTIRERGIQISLWINDESLNWSLEINGHRHEHVTSDDMESLIEFAVVAAELSLTKAFARRPQ